MSHLANSFFKQDFNVSVLIFFVIVGFLIGFFLKINYNKGKGHILKMEKDANNNQSRISALQQKVEALENENKALAGKNRQ